MGSRAVLYMAHPLGGDVHANLARAMRWLRWLRKSFPETTFVAPWIAAVVAGEDDGDPAQREAGLLDACAVAALLNGVVMVGGRVSAGMAREAASAVRVFDLTLLGEEPPDREHEAEVRGFFMFAPAATRGPAVDLHHSQGCDISEVIAAAAKDRGES